MDLISSVTINKLQTGVGEHKAGMGWELFTADYVCIPQ